MSEKQDPREEIISKLISDINKKHGSRSLIRLDEETHLGKAEILPTGVLTLDVALGGGMPKGRIVEIFGNEGAGKSLVSYITIASAQKNDLYCALVDAEHTYSKEFGAKLGVDNNKLYFNQPDYGEQALDIVEQVVQSSSFGIIVVDSVAALLPKAELEGEIGDQTIGLQARMMSQALRKLCALISKTNTIVVFINQVRDTIGKFGYGDTTTTPGGRALKFYSSVRIKVSKGITYKDKDNIAYGHQTIAQIVKNKVAPPLAKAYFDLIYREQEGGRIGIDRGMMYLENGIKLGIVSKEKNTYMVGDTKLGTEGEATVEIMKMPEVLDEINEAAVANPSIILADNKE